MGIEKISLFYENENKNFGVKFSKCILNKFYAFFQICICLLLYC